MLLDSHFVFPFVCLCVCEWKKSKKRNVALLRVASTRTLNTNGQISREPFRHQKATRPDICQSRFGTNDLVLYDTFQILFRHALLLLLLIHFLLSEVPHCHQPL